MDSINKVEEQEAVHKLAESGKEFLSLFEKDELLVEIYKPHLIDKQTPHNRNEFYLVISGEGKFKLLDDVITFKRGDFLYVPAFTEHRFIEFSDDFITWVFFTK